MQEGHCRDIRVRTQPTGDNLSQEIVRADAITSVSVNSDNGLAIRSDTQAVVSLAWGSMAGKPKPLQVGLHVCFLQTWNPASGGTNAHASLLSAG